MKSVGEAMAIGRTFKQALAKGLRRPGDRILGLHAEDARTGCGPPGRFVLPNFDMLGFVGFAFQSGDTV